MAHLATISLRRVFRLHHSTLDYQTVVALLLAAMIPWSAAGLCRPADLRMKGSQGAIRNSARPRVSVESLVSSLYQAVADNENEKVHVLASKLLSIQQLDAGTLLGIGVHLAQQGFYGEAALVFTRCAHDHPGVFEAHYDLALAEFALRRYHTAWAAIEEAPRNAEVDTAAREYLCGKIEWALGETGSARQDLAAAFQADPQQENYGLEFGLFCLRQHRYAEAARIFGRAADSNPRSPFLLLGLSLAEFQEGRDAECIQTSRKLVALAPQFSPARLLMAFVLYINGKLSDSENVAAAGLKEPRPDPYLYYLDVADLLKLHFTDYGCLLKEIAAAERGIPRCGLCLVAESKIHERQGNVHAAVAALEESVKIDPSYSDAWYRLALLDERTGHTEEAKTARARFNALKSAKETDEEETLKAVFMNALGGPESARAGR